MVFSSLLAVLLSAPPSAAIASQPQPSPDRAAPVLLATPADAARVCRELTPTDRVAFAGSPLERGQGTADHDARRDAALQGRYAVVVPARAIRFAPYDAGEQRLSMFGHAVPLGAGGGARLALVEDEGLPVRADPQAARRILDAQRQGTLALRVTFVLPEDDDAPCFAVPGAEASTFAAEPVAWEYVASDRVLARGGEGADRPLVSAAEGARPRVELGKPVDEGAGSGEIRTNAPEHVRELEGCYADALKRDPYLDGAIVAALEGGRGARGVRIAADSVQDEALAGCVRNVLARVDANGTGRTWLPIHFVLQAPGESAQPDQAQQ